MNLEKSSVFFFTNMSQKRRVQMGQVLQMKEAGEDCTYLRLPNIMKKSIVVTLGFLKDKVKQCVLSWDGKIISRGGKEVLVKPVAQSLPTYAMSVFILPEEITKDLERTISRFW